MDTSNIVALVVGVIAIIPGVAAYRSARKLQDKKVDAEAYDRAVSIWQKALISAEEEIRRLSEIVKTQRADHEWAEARISTLEEEVSRLRKKLNLPVEDN